MTTNEAQQVLQEFYEEKPNEGWFSYQLSGGFDLSGFGTNRIAKLIPKKQIVAFTIGATQRGERLKLRASIETIIAREGLKQVNEPSTSGSRPVVYQGINFRSCNPEQLRRVLLRVEGALIGAMNAGA